MKRITAVILCLLAVFGLAACGEAEPVQTAEPSPSAEAATESSPAETPAEAPAESAGTGGVLVAYFSATGNTRGVAELIAAELGADVYEIVPEEPYTEADLDYSDSSSRTTAEMNDPDARPAISGELPDAAQYDVVFLGYPIWWGQAPRIVNTFLEGCDLAGKTVVPFCTSGGSGIGSSATDLEALTEGAQWLEGRRFGAGASAEEVAEWVNGLELAPEA
ncbi:MAG: flavodoxin [Candidatus Scatomorpha sp.]|jgi:flavodoxin